ncbi:hypothetical protein [Kribbella sp. NPDC049584]|uniref:hypothetical protein n=1 Tax=Kribbella sp. NPDC049584 TaxID=3154833 RepID=UPI0034162AC1
MAIRIELWVDGRLVDGAEEWWDDIEASLDDEDGGGFPMLRRVDPYGDVVFEKEELGALAGEVRHLIPRVPVRVGTFLEKLAGLCDEGGTGTSSRLRFLGD